MTDDFKRIMLRTGKLGIAFRAFFIILFFAIIINHETISLIIMFILGYFYTRYFRAYRTFKKISREEKVIYHDWACEEDDGFYGGYMFLTDKSITYISYLKGGTESGYTIKLPDIIELGSSNDSKRELWLFGIIESKIFGPQRKHKLMGVLNRDEWFDRIEKAIADYKGKNPG